MYIGLGDKHTVDSLEISWPSGKKQKITGPITTNSTVIINEQ
jgi:hypothetical protein